MAKKADFQYNIFFLLGTGDTLNDEINLEARKYDDLIIGDFVDTYENLPLKTFLGFQFFAGFCYGNKKIINFHDSDAFVLLPDVIKDYQLNQDISDADYRQPWQPKAFLTDDSVYCIKGSKIKVQYKRDEVYPGGLAATYTSKWYNWIKDWPPEYHIPEYCNGNCNSMGPEAAIRIWREAQRTNRYTMRIEDKFFTGILRFKAGIPDEKVFPVTEMQKIVPGILNLNGLTRCLHVSQAEMVEKRENLLDTKMMNSSSIMTMITDWYINGDWLRRRPGFAYNGKDHLLARP